jgi:hypothetical protein
MGLFGGITGLMSGAGIILVYTLVVGGSDLGFPEFPIHEAALRSTRTGLISGMTALVLAPVFTGLMGQLITRRGFAQIALHPAEVEPH